MNARVWVSLVVLSVASVGIPAQPMVGPCARVGDSRPLIGVLEASGVVMGRSLWAINDSGNPPLLYRLGANGESSPVKVAGATLIDWEDLAIGRCDPADCLYVADIGDNQARRDRVTVYRVQEPGAGSTTTGPADVFQLTYPDRPHDAEALFVGVVPAQDLFIVTKEIPPLVYRATAPLKAGRTIALSFVRALAEKDRMTGAAASRDGRWIALRAYQRLYIYRARDFARRGTAVTVDLSSLGEPQGEGVGFGRDNELYLVSEAGNKGSAGLLTRLRCDFMR